MLNLNYLLQLLFLFLLLLPLFSTLSKSDKKKKTNIKIGGIFDIYDEFKLNYKDLVEKGLNFNKELSKIKIFQNGSTLAYVTPWNNYGYDIAKKFSNKFSLLSPVWLTISFDGNDFEIGGLHNIDIRWISDIKSKNNDLKIVPRLLFQHWTKENYIYVIKNEYLSNKLTETIGKMLSKYNFDGVVLEIWLQIGAYYKTETNHFIMHLKHNLVERRMLLLLAIPPPIYNGNNPGIFNGHDFSQLEAYVDYFSLMTYDYSSQTYPGPNAPLEWMKKCVNLLDPSATPYKRAKILMGLNFYGYKYSHMDAAAIVRHELIDILQKSKEVETIWHNDIKEHEFKVRQNDGLFLSLWYPTIQSVELRMKLAESLGVGISIWEIGQGLDYFYNVL